MDNIFVKTIIDFIHVIATILWIGGMITNMFIVRPALIKALEPQMAGKVMGLIMKRVRWVVYISIVLLGVTGIPLKIINENYISIINFENSWEIVSFIKHLCYGLMVLLAVYSFEIISPKLARESANGPSAVLQGLQKKQMAAGGLAFLSAIVVLILSSMMRYL